MVWRSFELDPSAPRHREGDYVGRLSSKYGVPREQAERRQARVVRTARSGAKAAIAEEAWLRAVIEALQAGRPVRTFLSRLIWK